METLASIGMVIIAAAMFVPFIGGLENSLQNIGIYKWLYTGGALVYTTARVVNVNYPGDSLRLRRLRRLEFWAGIAFCIGAFLLWYNCDKYHIGESGAIVGVGPLALMRDTIMFSLAGAVIQIVASWMISFRMKKELKSGNN